MALEVVAVVAVLFELRQMALEVVAVVAVLIVLLKVWVLVVVLVAVVYVHYRIGFQHHCSWSRRFYWVLVAVVY